MSRSLFLFSTLVLLAFNPDISLGQRHNSIHNPEKGAWQDFDTKPITYNLVQVFGKEFDDKNTNSVPFSEGKKIWGVDTDEDGNVYALDVNIPRLVKFSPKGELLWQIDQRGRGPGDLEYAYSLAVSDSVFITNIRGTRVDIFSKNGVYIKSVALNGFEGSFDFTIIGTIDNDYLVLKAAILGKIGARIVILDIKNNFSVGSDFTFTEETNVPFPSNWNVLNQSTIIDNYIVITSYLSYKMYYYDIEGKLVKEVSREFPEYKRPGIYISRGEGFHVTLIGDIGGHRKIDDKYLINYITWTENVDDDDAMDKFAKDIFNGDYPDRTYKNSIDLYSYEGKLLYSEEGEGLTPTIGKIRHIDHEGFLYTVTSDPFPQIKKYEVCINE